MLPAPKGQFPPCELKSVGGGKLRHPGGWEAHPDPKVERFRDKVRTHNGTDGAGLADPYAEFFSDDLSAVRCSRCKLKLRMDQPNQIKGWKCHRESHSCRKHGSSTPPITVFTVPVKPRTSIPVSLINTPCPGLQSSDDERILSYLQRTSVSGGGAKPRCVLCEMLFGKHVTLSDLSSHQATEVQRMERVTFLWTNVHSTLSVHSTSCHGIIQVVETQLTRPCVACRELLEVKSFINAISRPTPNPKNVKFTPHVITTPLVQDIVKRQLGIGELLTSVCSLSPFSLAPFTDRN